MCKLYFENIIEAKECVDILEPLRKDNIIIASAIYNRGIKTINDTIEFIHKYPKLYDTFKGTNVDLKFAARELFSHVLYEVVFEKGIEGAVEYLREYCKNVDNFILLLASVIINRIKIFSAYIEYLLLYEHDWYPLICLIDKCREFDNGKDKTESNYNSDSFQIEFFRFRLFEEILNPIFGKCDSQSKNEKIARIIKSKNKEIYILKEKCEIIARDVYLMPTKDVKLKQKKLNEMINNHIVEPLSEIIENPLKNVKKFLSDFILDSTVIAGVLTVMQDMNITTLTTAATAGGISSGIKYVINKSKREILPSDLLVVGMEKMKVKYEDVQNYLNRIPLEQLTIPYK